MRWPWVSRWRLDKLELSCVSQMAALRQSIDHIDKELYDLQRRCNELSDINWRLEAQMRNLREINDRLTQEIARRDRAEGFRKQG